MGLVEKVRQAARALVVAGAAAYIGWVGMGKPLLFPAKAPPHEIVSELRKKRGSKSLGGAVLSPDSRRIAVHDYREKGSPNSEIFVYDIEKQSLENITQSETREADPVWISNEVVKYLRADDFCEYWHNIRTGERGKMLSREFSALALAGSLFAVPVAFLLGYAFLRRRRGRPIFEPLIESSGTAFITGLAGTAAGLALTEPVRAAYPEFHSSVQPLYLAGGFFIPYACALYTNMFASVKPPFVRNRLKEIMNVFKCAGKPHEERVRLVEELRNIVRHPARVDLMRSDAALETGHIDDGLIWLRRALQNVDELADWNVATVLAVPFADAYFKWRLWKAGLPLTCLARAHLAIKNLNFKGMRRHLDEFVRMAGDAGSYAARAVFIQSISDSWPKFQALAPVITRRWENGLAAEGTSLESLADAAWRDAIINIVSQPDREQQFKPMGESRNEVLEYAANKFLKNLLVFKRCDIKHKQRLLDERGNMQYFRRYLGGKVVKSLAYVEHEGKAYHITMHGSGLTLERLVREGSDGTEVALKSAAETLARIHAIEISGTAEPAKNAEYYSDRLLQTFYKPLKEAGAQMPENLPALLRQFGLRVGRELSDAVMGAYKDANPRNWLVDEDGFAVAIDFEHRQRMPVQLDIVSALEFGPALVVDDASLDYFLAAGAGRASRQVRNFLDTYLAQIMLNEDYDRAEFLEQYRWAAPQRHMELAGYRLRDSELSAVDFHIGRAQKYAQALGENELAVALGKISVKGAAP